MRKSTGLLPQMICTISSIANARPNVNSSSATWPLLVDPSQAKSLDGRAERPGQQRGDQERGPEAEPIG